MTSVETRHLDCWSVLTKDGEGYFGEILEYPGCFTTGDTAVETITRLHDVAESWLLATEAQGQIVPQPLGLLPPLGKRFRELQAELSRLEAENKVLREALAKILALPPACVRALVSQRQIDEHGEEVGVSRQAVDEIHAALVFARSHLPDPTQPKTEVEG